MKNIKDYREKELNMYIIACVFILLCLTKDSSLNIYSIDQAINWSKLLDTTLLSSCLYIFVFISDSIFSSEFKQNIITLFGLIKMPGNIIFKEIETNCKDDRFTTEQALERYADIYANFPTDKKKSYKYQNAKWYMIYSKHRDVTMILVSNRDFLLCRDMVFVTITLIVLYIISVIMNLFQFNLVYILFLLGLLFVNLFTTHSKAKRFTYNVIAYDISQNNN